MRKFEQAAATLCLGLAGLWAGVGHAQTAASAPSAAKQQLVAQVVKLMQPGVEQLARSLAEEPARQLMQRAAPVIATVLAEKREALAHDIEADARKYTDESVPLVRERALALAPAAVGAILAERFSEAELRDLIAVLESPVNRKYLGLSAEMQRALTEKLVASAKEAVEPKVRALDESIAARLTVARAASAPSR
jgi:hypothetical protein